MRAYGSWNPLALPATPVAASEGGGLLGTIEDYLVEIVITRNKVTIIDG